MVDFAIIYEVKRGDLGPDNKLSTQGVRYSDVATARLAAFSAERAAQAAAWDAALDSDNERGQLMCERTAACMRIRACIQHTSFFAHP